MTMRALDFAAASSGLVVGDEFVDGPRLRAALDDARRQLDLPAKGLVACFTGRALSTVVVYLAALELGHAVLLQDRPAGPARRALVGTYGPELVLVDDPFDDVAGYTLRSVVQGARLLRRAADVGVEIHPELGVVLATSGSTAAPKAVRLSYANLSANAVAIVEALGLRAADVGITSLPLDYSFGLSIMNSHLVAGATLVLSPDSPTSQRFWVRFGHRECTNFGAVPVVYRLLRTVGWQPFQFPALRLMYQAGGALEVELVEHFGRAMLAHGGGFSTMYGATEATARMCCLAPEELLAHPRSVGRAVPGGRVSIEGAGAVEVGEIVYQGPNVMLGYARSRPELALGDVTGDVLRTGDLGYLRDGRLYVVGRRDRQVKLHGKRVLLDDIERRLGETGPVGVVPGPRDGAIAFVEGSAESFREVCRDTLRGLGLPRECLRVEPVRQLPRTSSGKVDLRTLTELATRLAEV